MNLSADDLKNLAAELILQQQQQYRDNVEDVGKSGDSDGQMSDDPVQNLGLGIGTKHSVSYNLRVHKILINSYFLMVYLKSSKNIY